MRTVYSSGSVGGKSIMAQFHPSLGESLFKSVIFPFPPREKYSHAEVSTNWSLLHNSSRSEHQAGSPGSSLAFQIVSDHRHGLMESSLIRQPQIEDECISLRALCLGRWVRILLLSTTSNKEHMTVSRITCLFAVVGFHWMQHLWIIPFFFWKRQSRLNLFCGEGGDKRRRRRV